LEVLDQWVHPVAPVPLDSKDFLDFLETLVQLELEVCRGTLDQWDLLEHREVLAKADLLEQQV